MSDLMKLDRDITPEDFFTDALVQVLSEVDLPDGLGPDRMQFNVVGEDGIEISIGVEEEEGLTLEYGQAIAPPIAVTVSSEDFQSIVAGDLRDAIMDATGGRARITARELRHAFMPDEMVQKIKPLSGDIQLRIEDADTGDQTVATITLGGNTPNPDSPTCTVTLSVPTLLQIASGKQNPQQLFMAGQLKIDGDMSVVLGLVTILQG